MGLDRRTILRLHALLSTNLLGNPKASGRLRAIPVSMEKSVYEAMVEMQLIDEVFSQILSAVFAISDPFEQAFFIAVRFPYLQSFEDVNKGYPDWPQIFRVQSARDLVPHGDRDHFQKIANKEIDELHEGNFIRYQLRLSEFLT
jgi:hypothetical protein